MSQEFLSGLGALGFIPRTHNNQPENNAGKNGEIDELATMYRNKSQNLQFYEPTNRTDTGIYLDSKIYGAETKITLDDNSDVSKFPFQVGLRFFPTVRPIEEILYGDGEK